MLDRERFFDQLWHQVPARPDLKAIIQAEQEDLHAFDIPIFTTTPSTCDIFTSKGMCIANFCTSSTLEQVKERLNELDVIDLKKQLWFIQASLATAQLRQNAHAVSLPGSLGSAPGVVTRERLLSEAIKIGERIEQMAFRNQREAQWLNLSLVNERNWEIAPAGASLYNGTAGIALFLAYLGKLTGRETYRALAEEAVHTVQKQVEQIQSMSLLGAFSGWGGIIYLYTHLGVLWEKPDYFHQAEEIIERSLILIEKDTMLDVMSGVAGYIAALLALDAVWPSQLAVATAIRAGDYLLLALKKIFAEQAVAFGIEATRPLTGFSHGMSGIALSLLRLAANCEEALYRDAALEAIDYERSVFSAEKQNWPDFRVLDRATTKQAPRSNDGQGESYMTAWCHGAAGIGLARLASLPCLDDTNTREEICVAINTTLKEGFGWCHSLCHSDLGNLELLLMARAQLNDQDYDSHIQRLLGAILAGMDQNGYITGVPLGLEVPSLMVGIAGMGYTFLRAAQPEHVPSLLTLEPPIRKEKGRLRDAHIKRS